MTVFRYMVFLVFCGTLCFCAKQEMLPVYDLKIGETIEHNKALDIRLVDIVDSRCPKFVDCFWEGQAEVFLDLILDNDLVTAISLIAREGHSDLADTSVMGYYFELLDVSPYPEYPDTIKTEEYVIRLRVED